VDIEIVVTFCEFRIYDESAVFDPHDVAELEEHVGFVVGKDSDGVKNIDLRLQ